LGITAISTFRQKLLGEDGSVRWGVIMVKQPGLFSPKFGATSSHVCTQSPQNVAVEPSASLYHNCCIDGGTSPEYFEYHLVCEMGGSKGHGVLVCDAE
jgi:hypothetical protein